MSKVDPLIDITSTYSAVAPLNENFDAIEEAFDNTLSLDGSAPNAMGADLDMNHFRVKNVGAPSSASDAVRLSDLEGVIAADGSDLAILATSIGASMIGAADGSTVQDSLEQDGIRAVSSYGTIDTTGHAATTLTAAFSDQGLGGTLYVDEDIAIGTANIANPGVAFLGQQPISYNAGAGDGGVVINKIGHNPYLLSWGLERLSQQFLNKVRAGTACKVIIIGDSNAASWWGSRFASRLAGIPGVTVVNNAVGSSTLDDWYNNTGTINGTGKDFASTMTANPDLLIDCYAGDTNGPYFGGTAASFDTLQAIVYAAIRAHTNGGKAAMGLLAVTGAPMRDGGAMSVEGGAKRDELHSARVRASTIRNCNASGVKAAFFDLNARFCDAELADLDSDVHTQNSLLDMAADSLLEWLLPPAYRGGAAIYIGDKATADLPDTYSDNISAFRIDDGAFDGFGFNVRASFGTQAHSLQFNWRYNAPGQIALRHSYDSGPSEIFGGWQYLGQTGVEAVTAAAGYTNPATLAGMNTRRDGGMTSVQGKLTMNTPGTIAATTTLATILSAYRPPVAINGVVLTCKTGGGAYEHIFASIETDGTIVTRSAAASTVAEIHINAVFRFA